MKKIKVKKWRLPKEIKIGGLTYKVRLFNKAERNAEGAELVSIGYISHSKKEIGIMKGLDKEDLRWAFIHELIHACIEAWNPLKGAFNKEEFVCPFSRFLFGAMENSKLLAK